MRRTFNQIRIDEKTTRNVVVVYDDPCEVDTPLYFNRQFLFLKYLADDPRIINPDTGTFQTLHIDYNGVCWTATAVAIIQT